MPQKTICRFAPSPTGYLHGGNLRVALLNYLYAKHHQGQFILRIDNTDQERSKDIYEIAIKEDLAWLGFEIDAIYRQSERYDYYKQAIEQLQKHNRLYACYETKEELILLRKEQEAQGKPPLYNRAGLYLSEEKKKQYQQEGRKPHYRFLLKDEDIGWQDKIKGAVHFPKNILSDPVLVREDGVPLYGLTSVVDDGLMAISLILRGDDHLTNSAAQIQLFSALGYQVPMMAHLPRMVDGAGAKLSKRKNAKSIGDYRNEGVHPTALLLYLAHLGLPTAADAKERMADLIKNIALEKFGKAEPKFFEKDLQTLGQKLLNSLSYDEAIDFYGKTKLSWLDATAWQKLRSTIHSKDDLLTWKKIITEEIFFKSSPADKDFLSLVQIKLPNDMTEDNIKNFLNDIKGQSGRQGQDFFHPLRLALTGRTDGPALPDIFFLLSKEIIIARLHNAIK